MIIRIHDMSDVASRDIKFRSIKADKVPLSAGFGDQLDTVVVLQQGESSWEGRAFGY